MAEETVLLQRLKNREPHSIDEAMEIYTPYLSVVLYNMLGTSLPREDIEEIISDVFVALWKNAGYIDLEKGTLRSYMAATARNLALKRLNKKRDFSFLDEIEMPDERDFAEEHSDKDSVWNAVMSMGEPDNEIFVRYYKFKYEKNNDIVVFSGSRYRSEINPTGTVISNVNDTDIYYFHYTDKCVPADYEMTEADKEAQAEGKLVFSCGSPDVTISEVQSVTWKQHGIQYRLMQIDGKLSADELAEMAEEAIERG